MNMDTDTINVHKGRNQALDLLKGFACMGVVFIHVQFPGLLGMTVHHISQFAVPCFFMISGYYALNADSSTIKRRLVKIIKIFIGAFVLWFACYFFMHILHNDLYTWINLLFTFKNLLKCIVFCVIDFASPLWYLIATIEAYILWFIIIRFNKEKFTVCLLPFLIILRLLAVTYVESRALHWYYVTNVITSSFTWFLTGYFIHLYKQKIASVSNVTLLINLTIGCIVSLIPIFYITTFDFSSVGVFLFSVVIFSLAIKYENAQCSNVITYIGNKLSLNVYILHALILIALHRINLSFLHLNNNFILYLKPLIILFVTILTAYLIEILKNRYITKVKIV